MKRLVALLCISSISLIAEDREPHKETIEQYGAISVAGDSADAALGTSMVGWGLGMAAGIALLSGLIKPTSNTGSDANSHAHSN